MCNDVLRPKNSVIYSLRNKTKFGGNANKRGRVFLGPNSNLKIHWISNTYLLLLWYHIDLWLCWFKIILKRPLVITFNEWIPSAICAREGKVCFKTSSTNFVISDQGGGAVFASQQYTPLFERIKRTLKQSRRFANCKKQQINNHYTLSFAAHKHISS